jgi:hypothetical protein
MLQPPHFVALADVAVSQPVFWSAGVQWWKPLLHAHLQEPAVQLGVAFTVLQAVPHLPQFCTLLSGLAHVPVQQSEPAAHAVVQRPQFFRSTLGSMQKPAQQSWVGFVQDPWPPPSGMQMSLHTPDGLQSCAPVQSDFCVH